MKTFRVCLTRDYLVEIKAENEENARFACEFFINYNVSDLSTEADRINHKFSIEEIECTVNEAFDCEEIQYA